MMILGADSHTCQAGCVSAFATGIGSTEIAAVWLDHIGTVGEDGANYKALEWKFLDENIGKEFTMDSRACISNPSMECGAKISVFPTDQITRKYTQAFLPSMKMNLK